MLQGQLDTQVTPDNAEGKLEGTGTKARKKGTVEVVKVPGVNHLLVSAQTGEVDEYASASHDRNVSKDVTERGERLAGEDVRRDPLGGQE